MRLETTVYDIAIRFGKRLQEILNGSFKIKALGHHVEAFSENDRVYVDLYPRGRYILMRVSGSRKALELIKRRPDKLPDGVTRYLIVMPGVEYREPPPRRVGRLNVFGYVKYRGNYYLVTAHRSHILLAAEATRKLIEDLRDDSLFYGMLDTSGKTPSFIMRGLGRRNELIELAEDEFGIRPVGCLESGGAGTVSAILLAYSHAHVIGVDRIKLLQRLVSNGNVRTPKRGF